MPSERRNAQDAEHSVARREFVRGAALLAAGLAAAATVDPVMADEPSRGSGRVRDFVRKVQGARLFDLAPVWDENSPIAAVNPTYSMELNATHTGTRGTFGDGGKLAASTARRASTRSGTSATTACSSAASTRGRPRRIRAASGAAAWGPIWTSRTIRRTCS